MWTQLFLSFSVVSLGINQRDSSSIWSHQTGSSLLLLWRREQQQLWGSEAQQQTSWSTTCPAGTSCHWTECYTAAAATLLQTNRCHISTGSLRNTLQIKAPSSWKHHLLAFYSWYRKSSSLYDWTGQNTCNTSLLDLSEGFQGSLRDISAMELHLFLLWAHDIMMTDYGLWKVN